MATKKEKVNPETVRPQPKKAAPPPELAAQPQAEPSEQVIKEIMIQKNVSRERAIEILKNPTK